MLEVSIAQGEAALFNDNATYGRLFKRRQQIEDVLKHRAGDNRHYLLQLLQNPDLQVRLNAAKAIRPLAPIESRQTIEAIAASREMPYAAEAGMSLYTWDQGIWKPE